MLTYIQVERCSADLIEMEDKTLFYREDFPRLSDAEKMKIWAFNQKPQMFFEIDGYDPKNDAWHATEWLSGLPILDVLIHEKSHTVSDGLVGKMVTFDSMTKAVKHYKPKKWLEIWINSFVFYN